MKRVNGDVLKAGDIVLTASRSKLSKGIRLATKGTVSHAMICVEHWSVIDSTADGVHSKNLQREIFEDDEEVSVFRLRAGLDSQKARQIVNFARSEIGTRYSTREAVRTIVARTKPRNGREFCSRLVARAYSSVCIELVRDPDYCTPDELRRSTLLDEIHGVTEDVSQEELAAWRQRPDAIKMMRDSQNAVLSVARGLDKSVENFTDIDRLVREHPAWDGAIAQAYRDSGYLDLWRHEQRINPWHYDIAAMEALTRVDTLQDLRAYCIGTVRDEHSGGERFAVNLRHYEDAEKVGGRETLRQLIALYQNLVSSDEARRATARTWLGRHFPADLHEHETRIIPHSDEWFAIVERVEPNLAAIARISIVSEGSNEVCSSCGDPARDYRLANAADAMPGVPSLRLCDDCVVIRRGFGEILVPFDEWNYILVK
jgi:Permuted papain-like amidase enzyme, YaeF/YiiX, C92 family